MSFTFNEEYVILSFGAVIAGVGIIVILISFIIKYVSFKIDHEISGYLVSFAILGCIFYLNTVLLIGIYCLYERNILSDNIWGSLNSLQASQWHFGQFCCYSYFLYRLYKGFKGTGYCISMKTYIMLLLLCITYFILCCIWIYISVWYIISGSSITDTILYKWIVIGAKSASLFIDLILSVLLYGIFVNKLYQVTKNLYDMSHVLLDQLDSIQDLTKQKESMFNIISKVSTLSLTMLLASQTVNILSLIHWIFQSNQIILMSFLWFRTIHSFITPLLVFMGFDFTYQWYNCCCNICHTKVQIYCISQMNSNSNKNASQK